jgi:hypothetical protein
VRLIGPELLVETGAYRGWTTRFLATLTEAPVVSIERNARHRMFARLNLRGVPRVRLLAGDSVRTLRRLVETSDLAGRRVLFYLDAHWGTELPVVPELETILDRRGPSVVVIDDFRVDDDEGYAYDCFGNSGCLELPLIAGVVERFRPRLFWPATPSTYETGARKGSIILASPALADVLSSSKQLRSVERAP